MRWSIETAYRYLKELLGLDPYQLLSYHAIKRYWSIQFLTINFLELERKKMSQQGHSMTLGDVVRHIRKQLFGQTVVYIYEQALAQKPLMEVLKDLDRNYSA